SFHTKGGERDRHWSRRHDGEFPAGLRHQVESFSRPQGVCALLPGQILRSAPAVRLATSRPRPIPRLAMFPAVTSDEGVMSISAIYDEAFFAMHVAWRAEYEAIADALVRAVAFSSVLDLGCGNGFLIERLAWHGKEVMGIDGSEHARQSAPQIL